MAAAADRIARAIDNYTMILVMLTEIIAVSAADGQPTRAQVDAVIDAASTSGVVRPQLTVNTDGETYNWTEWQQFVVSQLEALRKLQVMFAGPWEVRSQGRT